MLSFEDKGGTPIAKTREGLIYLNNEDDNRSTSSEDSDYDGVSDESDEGFGEFRSMGKVEPLLDMEKRSVAYVAGPSGSGKSSFSVMLIKRFLSIHPNYPFYLFSRTHYKMDPVFKGMNVNQIMIDESLITDPIDITQELTGGCIVFFDDCNTIQDDKIKKVVDKLMADILEVGRKLEIWIVITNHIVIPNEKKVARTIMNEMHSLTVFPKSGSSQQISYALKQYFGLSKDQIQKILQLPSRWVMIHKHYPMYVVYESGIYIL